MIQTIQETLGFDPTPILVHEFHDHIDFSPCTQLVRLLGSDVAQELNAIERLLVVPVLVTLHGHTIVVGHTSEFTPSVSMLLQPGGLNPTSHRPVPQAGLAETNGNVVVQFSQCRAPRLSSPRSTLPYRGHTHESVLKVAERLKRAVKSECAVTALHVYQPGFHRFLSDRNLPLPRKAGNKAKILTVIGGVGILPKVLYTNYTG
jgi:hypothetical protein